MILNRDCLILAIIGLFKRPFQVDYSLESIVVSMESHSSDLKTFWKKLREFDHIY